MLKLQSRDEAPGSIIDALPIDLLLATAGGDIVKAVILYCRIRKRTANSVMTKAN